jgi:hypothetical protein
MREKLFVRNAYQMNLLFLMNVELMCVFVWRIGSHGYMIRIWRKFILFASVIMQCGPRSFLIGCSLWLVLKIYHKKFLVNFYYFFKCKFDVTIFMISLIFPLHVHPVRYKVHQKSLKFW